MYIDIKTLISNIEKIVTIDWFIYSDSNKQNLVTSKKDDRSDKFILEVDLNSEDDHYLFLKAQADILEYDLGPYLISDKEMAKINSNAFIDTPIISVTTNKDNDGKVVSYSFTASDYIGKYDYKDTIIRININGAVIDTAVTRNKTLVINADKFTNGEIYEVTAMHRSSVGLTSNIGKYLFIINNSKIERYYVINDQDYLVDKLVNYYLDRSKLLNNIVGENIMISLLIKSLRNVNKKLEIIKQDYADGKDISEGIIHLKTSIENTVKDLNVDNVGDKSIADIITELKKKYKV